MFAVSSRLTSIRVSGQLNETIRKFRDEFEIAVVSAYQEQEALLSAASEKRSNKEPAIKTLHPKALPPAPQLFCGRRSLLEILVSQLCDPDTLQSRSHLAILGSGGIGKTSLALSAIHDETVVACFGQDTRFFISCESAPTKDAFVAAIADALGVDKDNQDLSGIIRMLSLIEGRALLILDNLETPWESPSNRADVEDVLSQLTSVPRVTLLITLRGAERPSGVRWHRPFLPPLQSVDILAARQIFVSISDMVPANEDEESALGQLLDVLDGVPLALTLMANLAQTNTYEELLQRWKEEKTSMLTRGFDSHLSSIDISIQVSLSSTRLQNLPIARRVLQILSLLPDGVEQDNLSKIMTPDADGHVPGLLAAVAALRQTALVVDDKLPPAGHLSSSPRSLRLLSPIREYVRSKLPIGRHDLVPLLKYYTELLQSRSPDSALSGDHQESIRLRSQIVNVSNVLAEVLINPDPPEDAIDCVVKLGPFSTISPASNVLLPLALAAAQKIGARALEGQCLMMNYYRHGAKPQQQILEARRVLEIAEELVESDPEKVKLKSRGFTLLGDAYRRNGQKAKALEALQDSLEMEVALGNFARQIQILYFMSNALEEEGDLQAALEVGMRSTKLGAEHPEFPIPRAYCTVQLGKVYFFRGLFRQAEECYRMALKIQDDVLADSGPSAISLFCLGELYYAEGRIQEAKPILEKAYQIQLMLGRADFASESGLILGRVYLSLGKIDECLTRTHVSFRRFGECQWVEGQIECLLSLSQVERLRGNLVTARLHLEEAKQLYRKNAGTGTGGDADILYEMGNVLSSGGSEAGDEASKYYIISALIRSRRGGRLSVAGCIKGVGDVALMDGRVLDAKSCYNATLALIRHTGDRRQIGGCFLGLGSVAFVLSGSARNECGLSESRHYYEKALTWYRRADDFWGMKACRDRLSSHGWQESDIREPTTINPEFN
ncbi:hypothetical protein SISSUDRAFT_1043703 [Sistotremastrum suecicum HHB10207 ss-3]|uniref:NACHT domain-containing protein n=1 Tax=Sistotremastrum suecicum HHB10207 ss-3 TaxID=1314776 RepID=A0A166FLA0_9AGAM|nr:hypothetical protein SISSUDRAFT_1043703 [Sistotremastrum suecicum HHB10207 ss-3]